MNEKINKWVVMKPRFAHWHLEHPEIYEGSWPDDTENITTYDVETQLYLMCLWGIPIKGFVKMEGSEPGCYGICFHHAGLSMFTFVDEKDFKWLK